VLGLGVAGQGCTLVDYFLKDVEDGVVERETYGIRVPQRVSAALVQFLPDVCPAQMSQAVQS